jgi:hypothetical protein
MTKTWQVVSRLISGVSAINPLVAYDIHEEREGWYSFILSRTRLYELRNSL